MRTQNMRGYKLLCGVAVCAMAINTLAPLVGDLLDMFDFSHGEQHDD